MRKTIFGLLLTLSFSATADVLEVNIWKSVPGKGQITMQNGQDARAIHEKLGATVTIGQDMMGRMHYGVAFKTWTEWVQFGNKLQASKEWQAFWAKISADPSAELEDHYLLNSPGADAIGGMYQVYIWESVPGHGAEMFQTAGEAKVLHEKAGASVAIHGDQLNRMHYVMSFKDWDAWGKFQDTPQTEFQEWFQKQSADPNAILVKVYTATSM